MLRVTFATGTPATSRCAKLPSAMSDFDVRELDREPFDATEFACPRCGETVAAEYYGPCANCRDGLRATYAGEQREVAAAAYEPKMNVVPNAIASKE